MSDDADFNYEQPGSTPDVGDIHRALIQEHMEPHEGDERVPVLLFLFFIGLAMWGGWYISEFDGGFYYSVLDGPAAFRQVDYSQNPNNAGPVDPVKLGRRVFNTCVTCHQTTGEGLPGKYPPLNGSEWVMGDDRILARIVLNGLSGPIEVRGQSFNGIMPAWKQLTDHDIAAVLTHIRSQWDNNAPPVAPAPVTAVRQEIASQAEPFKPADLLALELPEAVAYTEEEILAQYENAQPSAVEVVDESLWIKNLDAADVVEQLKIAQGDPVKGEALFTMATCVTCHVGVEDAKPVGPPLAEVSKRLQRDKIIESILEPSKEIAKGYESVKLMIWDGTLQVGLIVEETDELIKLRVASGETVEIPVDDIDGQAPSEVSPMPVGLVDMLSVQQVADLIAYLESL